jgi:hypothetical protein
MGHAMTAPRRAHASIMTTGTPPHMTEGRTQTHRIEPTHKRMMHAPQKRHRIIPRRMIFAQTTGSTE